jgi:tetratricopeptide (TPR) repeat protein
MTEVHLTAGHIVRFIFGLLLLGFIVGFVIWGYIQILKKSEDPPLLLFKTLLTLVLGGVWLFVAAPNAAKGGISALFALGVTLVEGIIMAITWRRTIAGLVANPIGALYDGGTAQYEPVPVYSTAQALRKRGDFLGALASVRKQLEQFPTDIEGQLLMAEIQAENLNDLPGAAISIERICNQPGHTPRNVALGLNMLADWYLKLHQDRDTARETLQRIVERFPDSEVSNLAAQRIGSLASTEHLLASHDRKKFAVAEGVKDIGLIDPKSYQAPANPDATLQATELVAHLQAHPLDTEAREKLAVIYADHYNRIDMATDQIEQLIAHPNQPQKRVVHWLNRLADLQIRHGSNYETVRATIQRIVDLYPGAPPSEIAANRINLLKLELKGREKVTDIKMGTYEQDVGLKMKGGS